MTTAATCSPGEGMFTIVKIWFLSFIRLYKCSIPYADNVSGFNISRQNLAFFKRKHVKYQMNYSDFSYSYQNLAKTHKSFGKPARSTQLTLCTGGVKDDAKMGQTPVSQMQENQRHQDCGDDHVDVLEGVLELARSSSEGPEPDSYKESGHKDY